MSEKKETKTEQKSFVRRDTLINIETKIKEKWEKEKPYEIDAPEDTKKPKYLITFPYPYMNGRLHLGHAFSLTKCEFAARFHKLLGENVLFPFAFHCTGMPIMAAANKIKREMELYGNPPKFPEKKVEIEEEEKKEEKKEEKEVAFKDTTKHSSKKGKVSAKTGDAVYQWNIMKGMGLDEKEIPKFADPLYWLYFFPPLGKEDLIHFGSAIDFRRSFITTEVNPFYDSFIRWQFNRLKDLGLIVFLKRYAIFSTIDKQPCADHDRAQGEGVKPQEYTLIKMQVQEPFPKVLEEFKKKKVYLVPATLRPETMYGQTNCWVLAEGEYGAFQVSDDEIFVCTERAARNLSYQGYPSFDGTVKCLATFTGQDLIGCPLSAPNSLVYKTVYCLPMFGVSTQKGTGVVTSVPSDSPDDYITLQDLKNKDKLREKFSVKDEWVLPFDVVPIINIPEYGDKSAPTVCEMKKIRSQNDRIQLTEAKDLVYNKGFYEGKLLVGEHKGSIVKDVKEKIQSQLIKDGLAIKYAEPESVVISRSGDECVVAYTDQWFLKYGEDDWKKKVEDYVKNNLETYNPGTKNLLLGTIGWLKEWACSREFGLGTKLPCDERYVIESLSDSTIYMAFYTFAHILQGGIMEGNKVFDVKPEDLTKEVWDYILIGGKHPEKTNFPEKVLEKMKKEFDYWYGVDLRTSGKDLIQNHLTMFLYNHVGIFPNKNHLPKSIYANGHVLVDGEKMSKSKGNFLLLGQTIKEYSCDATRIALADAGDGLDDANFLRQTADESILRLTTYITWVKEILETKLRTGEKNLFADKVFEHRMRNAIHKAKEAYKSMHFREALRYSWYDFQKIRDDYRVGVDSNGMHHDLIMKFIEYQSLIMQPITPHISEYIWSLIKDTSIHKAEWPAIEEADIRTIRTYEYFESNVHGFRVKLEKEEETFKKKNKDKPFVKPEEAYIYVCVKYADWQRNVLSILRDVVKSEGTIPKDIAKYLKGKVESKDMSNVMTFVSYLRDEFEKYSTDTLKDEVPYDEMKIMSENSGYLVKTLALKKVSIFAVGDSDIPDPMKRVALTQTGKPQICFVYPK